jgi:hypothetical protein
MGAFAAPILPGKMDAWEAWMAELTGPRRAAFDDMNERMALTGHRAWLQATPDGHHMVVVVIDGPGGDAFMGKLAASDNEFDAWFRGKVTEVHGIDFSGPLPPAPEQRL